MTTHVTGAREEWLKARLGLLNEEKRLRRRSDEVAGPWLHRHDECGHG
jgi:predicted dithiol-disulfide oxidoreductase (DUF899 family)